VQNAPDQQMVRVSVWARVQVSVRLGAREGVSQLMDLGYLVEAQRTKPRKYSLYDQGKNTVLQVIPDY